MKCCKLGAFVALLFAVCLPAVAQSGLQIDVPFDFMVSGKTMPAGHYKVQPIFQNNTAWSLVGEHGSAAVLTNSVESAGTKHNLSMIFLHDGGAYLLSEIWPDGRLGRTVMEPRVKQTLVAKGDKQVEINAE